jgi:hypothetical protein
LLVLNRPLPRRCRLWWCWPAASRFRTWMDWHDRRAELSPPTMRWWVHVEPAPRSNQIWL